MKNQIQKTLDENHLSYFNSQIRHVVRALLAMMVEKDHRRKAAFSWAKIAPWGLLALIVIVLSAASAFAQEAPSLQLKPDTSIYKVDLSSLALALEKQDADSQSNQSAHQSGQTKGSSSSTSLSANEKLKYALRRAFLRPTPYILTGMGAAFTQWGEKNQPQKDTGDNFADGLSRYAIDFATGTTKIMFVSGIYPVIFHQDPRYKPSGKQGFKPRLLYAASRVFVTESDKGQSQVNISRLAGDMTASALANIWERSTPDHDRIGVVATFNRFAKMIEFDIVRLVITEFWPDIKRKVLKR